MKCRAAPLAVRPGAVAVPGARLGSRVALGILGLKCKGAARFPTRHARVGERGGRRTAVVCAPGIRGEARGGLQHRDGVPREREPEVRARTNVTCRGAVQCEVLPWRGRDPGMGG